MYLFTLGVPLAYRFGFIFRIWYLFNALFGNILIVVTAIVTKCRFLRSSHILIVLVSGRYCGFMRFLVGLHFVAFSGWVVLFAVSSLVISSPALSAWLKVAFVSDVAFPPNRCLCSLPHFLIVTR